MNNIEKQLNNLPKGRLSGRADLNIRFKLMSAGIKQSFSSFGFNIFSAGKLRPVLALVVILVLAFSGVTSAYAYNSNEVTRASILYPVKRGLEKIESSFASSAEAQVKFHNKLAERRIAEAQFLIQTATTSLPIVGTSSDDRVIPDKFEYEDEFNDTLHDADNEIDRANQKAGEIKDRIKLDRSLTVLSDAHLNDLEKIKAMAEDVGIEADDRTTDNIALVLDNIKKHQQRIVQAISQFDGDLKRAAERDQTAASSSLASEEEDKHASTTPEQAVSSLNQVKSDIKDLTSELSQNGRVSNKQIKKLTERLNKKIEQAKNAMEAGDLNKFNGLLRATEALTNNGLHFLRENQPQEKQIEIEYKENTGGKIKAQFTPAELLQKQEEQRKKFEEQRKEDEEKIYRQNQFDLNTGTTSRQISSSSLNLQTEQRRDGTDQIASTSAEHED